MVSYFGQKIISFVHIIHKIIFSLTFLVPILGTKMPMKTVTLRTQKVMTLKRDSGM